MPTWSYKSTTYTFQKTEIGSRQALFEKKAAKKRQIEQNRKNQARIKKAAEDSKKTKEQRKSEEIENRKRADLKRKKYNEDRKKRAQKLEKIQKQIDENLKTDKNYYDKAQVERLKKAAEKYWW